MSFHYLDRIIVHQDSTVKDVLERFNETAIYTEQSGFAIITDEDGKCVGVVSDGDIRRKLLENVALDAPVETVMNRDFVFAYKSDSDHKILRHFDEKVTNLPVLDANLRPVNLYQYSKFVPSFISKKQIIRARVPVRVSFSGGGTDMSSYINKKPAAVLSSTINKYCTASVIVRDDDEVHIISKDLDLMYSAKNIDEIEFGDAQDLIKSAVKIMQPNFGFDLETSAEFEPGTGLGGSSALVISVLGALNYFRNEQQLDIYKLADLAYQVERIDMNIQGGWQDQYSTAFGGFCWIEFCQNEVVVHPIKLRRDILLELEYNLMLFRVGEKRSSSEIQSRYIKMIESRTENTKSFEGMTELAVKMKEALLKGEVKTFADLLHESWEQKKKMNKYVTNEFIEDCYTIARDLGALGGKLLGAGGCGYLLLYASPLHQRKIREALHEMGVKEERFKFSENGLEVWSTKR